MSGVYTAVAAGTVISAGIGYMASDDAADAGKDAAKRAENTELAMYDQTRADLAPWREAGEWALGTQGGQPTDVSFNEAEYMAMYPDVANPKNWSEGKTGYEHYLMYGQDEGRYASYNARDLAEGKIGPDAPANGLKGMIEAGPGEFTESPGYQFTLNEGLNAQQNALSAMGANRSGKHIKAATDYAEGMASTEYDNFLSRWYQSLTPYQSMAGLGLTGAQTTAQAGSQAAGGAAQAQIYGGDARAAGSINSANALTGAMTGGANQLLYLNAMRNYQPAGGGGANWGGYTGNDPYSGNYGIR